MKPSRNEDLPVFVRWMEFLKWLLPATEKFPRRVRFTFANRIDSLALDVVENLVEARYSRNKREVLKRANLHLDKDPCVAAPWPRGEVSVARSL